MKKCKFKIKKSIRSLDIRIGSIIETNDEDIGLEEFEINNLVSTISNVNRRYTKVFGIKKDSKDSIYLFKLEDIRQYISSGYLRIKLY